MVIFLPFAKVVDVDVRFTAPFPFIFMFILLVLNESVKNESKFPNVCVGNIGIEMYWFPRVAGTELPKSLLKKRNGFLLKRFSTFFFF